MTAFLPTLAAEDAARIVAEMTPAARTRIGDHLRRHPDALVSGASDAPQSVQALITALTEAGIAGVRPAACLRCGRARPLRRAVPGGRVCRGCRGCRGCEGTLAIRGNVGPCAACGETRSCSGCGRPSPTDPCSSCKPRAEQWRRRASTDWTAYLEARDAGRVSGGATTGP